MIALPLPTWSWRFPSGKGGGVNITQQSLLSIDGQTRGLGGEHYSAVMEKHEGWALLNIKGGTRGGGITQH